MKYIRTLGCISVIYASLAFNVNAATAHYETDLDLTDLQYEAVINGIPGKVAANISRVDLGTGWDGEIDVKVTSDSYNPLTTTLGFALTTDPNDTLLSNPDTFFQLAEPNVDVAEFFNENVEGWVMYGWGYSNLPPGETNSLTDSLNPMQFDPEQNYYAFVAGGSTLSTDVSVSFDISDGNEVSPVPLPAAVWFFGTGLVGLLGMARRKLS